MSLDGAIDALAPHHDEFGFMTARAWDEENTDGHVILHRMFGFVLDLCKGIGSLRRFGRAPHHHLADGIDAKIGVYTAVRAKN